MFSHSALFCFVITVVIGSSHSARILGVVPMPSYSHQIVFKQIWRELSLRGHDVTLISTDPINDSALTNLTNIDISFAYHLMHNKYNLSNVIKERNPITLMSKAMFLLHNMMDDILASEVVQTLIKNETEHFDLVMIEFGIPPAFAFQHRFNCPVIGISSLDPGQFAHEVMGNPTHPVVNPEPIMPISGELTFLERLTSTVYVNIMSWYFDWAWMDESDEIVRKRFGPGYPSLRQITKRIDMLFINTHPVLHRVRPLAPATIMIGGGIHLEKPKPLPKDLQRYFDGSTNGVIYFSLGSNFKSKSLNADRLQVLMETFASLPYDVLWKFEDDNLPGKPDNVKLIKWAPQQDVLRHPKILAFISQCGLQSTDEAFFNNVPVVAMPVFGDQENNAKSIVKNGFGVSIDFRTMTVDSLRKTILEVIENPIYRKRVQDLSRLAKDEPMTGLEKAVWWTEYVLRNKGNLRHLKSRVVDLPSYQYYLIDVIGFCIAFISLICFIIYKIVKVIINLKCGLFRKNKVKTQ